MRRRVITLVFCIAALGGLAPGAAQARRLQPLLDQPPLSTHFKDAVITGDRKGPVARAAADRMQFKPYPVKEGYSVAVAVSPRYTNLDQAVVQSYVDFLDELPHSTELKFLGIYIAPPDEVLADCGGQPGTLACYLTQPQTMIVPGEQTDAGFGVSTSYVITHEYGHHIANHRTNAPFDAFTFGPKYWASYEMVCDKTDKGLLAPGNEAELYDRNPGEGWAETYAHMKYPDQRWQMTPLLAPDEGAFAAAAKDVADTPTRMQAKVFRGRGTRTFHFTLALDGPLSFRLQGPKRANYNLVVSSDGGGGGTTHAAGSRDVLAYKAVCRTLAAENVSVTVKRVKGSGPFTLRIWYAG